MRFADAPGLKFVYGPNLQALDPNGATIKYCNEGGLAKAFSPLTQDPRASSFRVHLEWEDHVPKELWGSNKRLTVRLYQELPDGKEAEISAGQAFPRPYDDFDMHWLSSVLKAPEAIATWLNEGFVAEGGVAVFAESAIYIDKFTDRQTFVDLNLLQKVAALIPEGKQGFHAGLLSDEQFQFERLPNGSFRITDYRHSGYGANTSIYTIDPSNGSVVLKSSGYNTMPSSPGLIFGSRENEGVYVKGARLNDYLKRAQQGIADRQHYNDTLDQRWQQWEANGRGLWGRPRGPMQIFFNSKEG